jgi:hypothetical protein
MLEDYCARLGIRLSEEGFYGEDAILVLIGDPLPASSRKYTLDEARRELGIL